MDSTHVLCRLTRHTFGPANAAGDVDLTMRHIVYVFYPAAILDNAAQAVAAPPFYIKIGRVNRLVCALMDAGMPDTPLDGLSAAQQLVATFATKLTTADRLVTIADIRQLNTAVPWSPAMAVGMLRGGDRGNDAVMDTLLLIRDAFRTAGASGANATLCFTLMLPSSVDAAATNGEKAMHAVQHLRDTSPANLGRSIEYALEDFHISRRDWPDLAADRGAWRETLRLRHPPGWQPTPPTPPLAARRQTRRAAIDTNCNIDASLRALRAPLPH